MALEHHEPVTCVTYSLDTAVQISAARASYRRQVFRRKTLVRMGIALVVFVALGAGIGWALDDDPLWLALICAAEVLVFFPALFLTFYALIPRRIGRLVRQSKAFSKPVEACWSAAGLSTRMEGVATDYAWRDYHGWHSAKAGLLLYLNDQQYQLIPAAALSQAHRDALAAILEASGVTRL